MQLGTQIGGTNERRIRAVKDLLERHGVSVAHPKSDELVFYLPPGKWQYYESELQLFESIATSSFHVICNDKTPLDDRLGLELLYAMIKQKPIILTQHPRYDKALGTFMRNALRAHSRQWQVLNMAEATPEQIEEAIKGMPLQVDYELSRHEEVMTKILTKSHFRALLGDANKMLDAASVNV